MGQPILGEEVETAFQFVLIAAGLFILGPGLYVSVQSIIDNYATVVSRRPSHVQTLALIGLRRVRSWCAVSLYATVVSSSLASVCILTSH